MLPLPKPTLERAARFAARVADEAAVASARRTEILGAVIQFLTVRRTRFPRLAASLLTRFADDRLPPATVRALRESAQAATRPIPKPAPAPKSVPAAGPKRSRKRATPKARVIFSHCSVFVPAGGLCVLRTTEQAKAAGYDSVAAWVDSLTRPPASGRRAFINERIDALLAPIRRHAQTYPDARNERHRVAHIALLEQARAQFLASVAE